MKVKKLSEILDYPFKNEHLLKRALTHSSNNTDENYERLEFLGDAVLELCVSEYLYSHFLSNDEGTLTKMRAQIVCEASLSSWARRVGLGEHLILGKSEEMSGGKNKSSILCDVTEAIIGAIYLDSGIEMARVFIMKIIGDHFSDISEQTIERDAKSELQILLQKDGNINLVYDVYKKAGPPHDATFFVHAILNGKIIASGVGKSKKQAEQNAAAKALKDYQ